MPASPVVGAGVVPDQLRKEAASRRRRWRSARLLALGSIGAVPALSTLVILAPTLFVWNASASAPRGLYWVKPGARPRAGDMVIAWPPARARALAAKRGYLPADVPLVKRISAVAGNRVCADERRVTINGRTAAVRLKWDAKGRPMPQWTGCVRLGAGQYLLLMDHRWSFDGRYFGVTQSRDIVGRARRIWPR